MHADLRLHERAVAAAPLTPLRAFLAVAALVVAVLALFAPTTATMVGTWYRSETFTHGFLVVPVVLWFVWTRREELARVPIRPSAWALVPLAGAGALWLLGELSSSAAPSQFGVIAMIPSLVAALLGWRWVRALAFPLAFLVFAVPFGEFLVPTLIDWTADFTVSAVAASGVPVYREANSFVIPSGRWSVVEACSGIRYLIASVMLGSLYAWMMYRSARRRALFIAAAIAVPLVANWLRAYGIVMLGHLSDNRIATGVDHLIYGWIFFGVLMTAMFWIGARWREEPEPADHGRGRPLFRRPVPRAALLAQCALAAVAVGVWPLAQATLAAHADVRPVPPLSLAGTRGWAAVDAGTPAGWMPDLAGAARTEVLSFAKDGHTVSVVVAVFRDQKPGAKLVTSTNQLVHQDNTRWRIVDRATRELADDTGRHPAHAALLRGQGRLLAAAQWYWLGGERTTSDTTAKIRLALDRLRLRTDTSAWIVLVTPADESLRDAWPVLERFSRDMGASLQSALGEMANR